MRRPVIVALALLAVGLFLAVPNPVTDRVEPLAAWPSADFNAPRRELGLPPLVVLDGSQQIGALLVLVALLLLAYTAGRRGRR